MIPKKSCSASWDKKPDMIVGKNTPLMSSVKNCQSQCTRNNKFSLEIAPVSLRLRFRIEKYKSRDH